MKYAGCHPPMITQNPIRQQRANRTSTWVPAPPALAAGQRRESGRPGADPRRRNRGRAPQNRGTTSKSQQEHPNPAAATSRTWRSRTPGELLGLARSDVDLLHRKLAVTKQRQELKGGIDVSAPKTAAGIRSVAIPASILPDLEDHRARWTQPGSWSAMFVGPKGGLRRTTFYKAWEAAVERANVRADLRPHDLRHLANTLAARVPGTTSKDLMWRMGHKSPQAALGYLHTVKRRTRQCRLASTLRSARYVARRARGPDREPPEPRGLRQVAYAEGGSVLPLMRLSVAHRESRRMLDAALSPAARSRDVERMLNVA